jgi:hypothetical protein
MFKANKVPPITNIDTAKNFNTLSFVINHMENELKTKCMYLSENEIESFHFVKSK